MAVPTSQQPGRALHPSLTWLFVFIPAIAYLLGTRASGLAVSGDIVANQIFLTSHDVMTCRRLSSIVSLSNARCEQREYETENQIDLSYPLLVVQNDGLMDIISTLWRHDSELGRGYLLLADSVTAASQGQPSHGRVWRWEVGGGPIAIGKTLHLDQAGCRSGAYLSCRVEDQQTTSLSALGPGGMAVDFYSKEHFAEGRLVVSEWGEGRIVRLEENGARTPLVYHVPDICHNATVTRRVNQPSHLQYSPFGDLFLVDHYTECNQSALMVLKNAVHVPGLESLAESRAAHFSWTHNLELPEVVLTSSVLGGLSLSNDWKSLFISSKQDGRVAILKVALVNESLEDEGEETPPWAVDPQVFLQLPQNQYSEPGSIAIDQLGNVFWALDDRILLIDPNARVLGTIVVGRHIRSITLGEDGFLYVASSDSLLRMPVISRPSKTPTDIVKKRSPQARAS